MRPARPPRPARALGAAATAAALVLLAGAAWSAWRAAAAEGWEAHGLGWLVLERFARARPLVPALAAAAVVLGLALVAARARVGARVWRAARVEHFGHPVCALAALGAALVLPGVVVRGTRPAPARRAPSVLVVVVDSWRADHAGFLGYPRAVSPNLDRIAARGVVLERALAPSSWAKPSVATLLTGLVPARHGAVAEGVGDRPGARIDPGVTTLVEVLHGRGWETAMWSGNPDVTPATGFDQGAERFRDYAHAPCHTDECGRVDEVLADVERWLAEERDPTRPFCAYVHVPDVRFPFEAPAGFRGTFEREARSRAAEPVTPDEALALPRLVDRYDEELLTVDLLLGPFLERVWEEHPNVVIVLAGAHGEELGDHGGTGHGHALWQELVHVPLVILSRSLEPGRVALQVRLMDVAPTLLELVGLPDALPGMQGESLLPVIAELETADRLAPMELGTGSERCVALSDGTAKALRQGERWSWFDLAAGESVERIGEHAEEARALLGRMASEGWGEVGRTEAPPRP